jgi:FixJ family two-component response regulator
MVVLALTAVTIDTNGRWTLTPERRTLATHGVRTSIVTKVGRVVSQQCEQLAMVKSSFVAVVDDNESVRESLPDLLREFGLAARAFSSAEEFLASDAISETSCLILDVAMPGMSGPDLQRELAHRRQAVPIVFITASGGETVRSRLLARSAVACLFKPFSDTALLDALNAALHAN